MASTSDVLSDLKPDITMTVKNIAYTLGLAGILSVTAGCSKFVDINTDPNNPTEAELPLLLPATEVSLVANMYQLNSGASTYVQHLIFSGALSRYQQQGTTFDDSWTAMGLCSYCQTRKSLPR
jgi:hypothetical protein